MLQGKISDADLSAATRPDLQEVAAPTLTHTPGEAVLANLPTDLPSPKMQVCTLSHTAPRCR